MALHDTMQYQFQLGSSFCHQLWYNGVQSNFTVKKLEAQLSQIKSTNIQIQIIRNTQDPSQTNHHQELGSPNTTP